MKRALVLSLAVLALITPPASAAVVRIELHIGEPCPALPTEVAGCAYPDAAGTTYVDRLDADLLLHEIGHQLDFQLFDPRLRGIFARTWAPGVWDREVFADTVAACGMEPPTTRPERRRCRLIARVAAG